MKYSISILFLLTIFAAIEAALFRQRLEGAILVLVGVAMVLLWMRWQEFLSKPFDSTRATNQQGAVATTNTTSNKVLVCIIASCFGAAIVSILTGVTDQTGKVANTNPQIISANSVLVLATILLSSSLVHRPSRSTGPLRAVFTFLIVFAMVTALAFLVDPLFWYVYMACRGIESAMVDPNHILGSSRVLIYSTAAIKAAVGGVGWCLWLLVAVFAYRRAQRRSNGLFVEVWIACGLGCLATYLQWRFLLDDFPELRSSLSVVLRQTYNYNLLLFLILGVAGFLQYCLIDRNSIQSIACEDQVWLSRLLGLMIMLPLLFVLVVKALNLSRQSFGWLGWIVLASELFSKESLMLLALLLFGLQVVANARNGPAKFNELAAVAHVQLTLTGCILIVLLPLHFAASQFYFDAVTMLSPKY